MPQLPFSPLNQVPTGYQVPAPSAPGGTEQGAAMLPPDLETRLIIQALLESGMIGGLGGTPQQDKTLEAITGQMGNMPRTGRDIQNTQTGQSVPERRNPGVRPNQPGATANAMQSLPFIIAQALGLQSPDTAAITGAKGAPAFYPPTP